MWKRLRRNNIGICEDLNWASKEQHMFYNKGDALLNYIPEEAV